MQLSNMGFVEDRDYFNSDNIFIYNKPKTETYQLNKILKDQEAILHLTAKLNIEKNKNIGCIKNLEEVEFKVYSQWGEDGIIQHLIHNIEIPNKTFIEFGVQDYQESNTRFLLMNNNWDGLVIEMNRQDVEKIKKDEIFYKYNLMLENSFITKDNINDIFKKHNITGDIGLLSIDIDGNDYWVWKEIDVISPRIIICEYNNIFPKDIAYTIPYTEKFYRTDAHYSNLYYGANLKALHQLASEKGYEFVGTNSVRTNAFFVRKDLLGEKVFAANLEEYNVESKIRESRDITGKLNYLSGSSRLKEIKGMVLYNIENGENVII